MRGEKDPPKGLVPLFLILPIYHAHVADVGLWVLEVAEEVRRDVQETLRIIAVYIIIPVMKLSFGKGANSFVTADKTSVGYLC